MTENEYLQIKEFVLEELKKIYPAPSIRLWFEPMKVVMLDGTNITISLPQNKKMFVQTQYYSVLKNKFSEIIGVDMNLTIISEEEEEDIVPSEDEKVETAYKMRFNPDYTFENFVVGKSNQLAQSASVAVAKHPAELNNPLFLYGPSGLGKTHLLFSIMNQIKKDHPDFNVWYVTGEEFTIELIESLSLKKPMVFREKYRNLDVLLVDDIQFIAGKMSVQEEFFHTFDTLFRMNKQIILASDVAPKDISNLEDRLKTRFEMGLVADIQPPDLELRVAIFKRKAMDFNYDLDMDVLYYLARSITTNIRQIEGALKKLKAHTLITGEECTLEVAKRTLNEFFVNAKSEETVIQKIFDYVQKRYGVKEEQLKSATRANDVAKARHCAVYLIKETTKLSQVSIAKMFNRKDHTTVINSIEYIKKKMNENPNFEKEINNIIADITG